jgi:hypothetical protein
MARPKVDTVEYFPHYCDNKGSGTTKFILISQYGKDGFTFLFRMFEMLGKTPGHYFDCRNVGKWLHLLAYTMVEEETALKILKTLVDLEDIDRELWEEHKIIWSDNFVQGLKPAYDNRKRDLPQKPVINRVSTSSNDSPSEVSIGEKPQKKRKESKRKEDIVESDFDVNESFEKIWAQYPNKDGKKEALRHYKATVKNDADAERCNQALIKYKSHLAKETWKRPKNGSTWFNNWEDWELWIEPTTPEEREQIADKIKSTEQELLYADEQVKKLNESLEILGKDHPQYKDTEKRLKGWERGQKVIEARLKKLRDKI